MVNFMPVNFTSPGPFSGTQLRLACRGGLFLVCFNVCTHRPGLGRLTNRWACYPLRYCSSHHHTPWHLAWVGKFLNMSWSQTKCITLSADILVYHNERLSGISYLGLPLHIFSHWSFQPVQYVVFFPCHTRISCVTMHATNTESIKFQYLALVQRQTSRCKCIINNNNEKKVAYRLEDQH